jgi:hypothetical protein
LHAAEGLQADFFAVDGGRVGVVLGYGVEGGPAGLGDGDAEDAAAEGGGDGLGVGAGGIGFKAAESFLDDSGGELVFVGFWST